MQTLDVISVNIWQILVSLINLVLLFLIVKHFLYKPVKAVLEKRREAIDRDFGEAASAREKALSDKAEYEKRLEDASLEAEDILRNARALADLREAELLCEAKRRAEAIVRKAEDDAVLERKKAEDDIKREIAEVSALISEKILQREISADDHKRLIDSFIDEIGADDETN